MEETEVKIEINKEILERIVLLLGQPEFFIQENWIYSLSNGFLRVRLEKGIFLLTFKGIRKKDNPFNCREEIELKVGSSEILTILERLGLVQELNYKKKRANFKVNNCILSLDILPGNKKYIEIEGNKKEINDVLKLLKLNNSEIENRPYQEILKNV